VPIAVKNINPPLLTVQLSSLNSHTVVAPVALTEFYTTTA